MGILTPEMQRLVREQRLGYVASISPDGYPNLSPKGSMTVADDDHLVFADVDSPHTIRNLAQNPRTEVNVVDPFARKGYRFRGTAQVLHTGGPYWQVIEMYRAEGSDVRRIRAVALITVEKASPLVSPIYTTPVVEDDVRAIWEEYHAKQKRVVTDLIPPRDF